ncbi:MAG: LacI family DNA-binding transcriptional regulator [Lachnospiraceae bacterium]|nr:LacI family DNA-binding transcriptional regulator [Lachnospiraceae bacterium]
MNIRELAQLAGVSASTVSKIMNNKDSSISPSTRERVLQIAKQYNYQSYSSLIEKGTTTLTLGVVFRSASTMNLTLDGILNAAQNAGYTILLRESGDDPEREAQNISVLCSHHVDGLLWEFVNKDSEKNIPFLARHEIPAVIFHSEYGDAVNIDYQELGRQAAQTLVDAGHTSIACIRAPIPGREAFTAGYQRCLFENHIPLEEELIFGQIDSQLTQKIASHAISGVVSAHYETAARLYDAVRKLRYELPYDVSIVSLRDESMTPDVLRQLSTFTIPHYAYGEYLCKRLVGQIERGDTSPPAFRKTAHLDSESTVGIPHSSHTKKITVVGSINIDNYLKMDALPRTGMTVSSSLSASYVGGKAINQAIGAAKLGQRVSVIGRLGNDVDSDTVYRALNMAGVDSIGVKRCSGYKTGQAYIFVQKDGDSMISILSGANEALLPQDIRESERVFENTAFCLVQTEIPMDTVTEACRIAKKHGAQTILKPVACGSLPAELLCNVDIIVPNKAEIGAICPAADDLDSQAAQLLEAGVGTVIVTLGGAGCFVKTAHEAEYLPAVPSDVVDASGAADAFISALASYLLEGRSLHTAIRIASYAAGFTIAREGVTSALVDKNTLESYMMQREPDLL